jgi:hypothetical protein
MSPEAAPSRRLILGLAAVVLFVGMAVWVPRLWEKRLFRQAEEIAGVGSKQLPGSVSEARRKIDSGMSLEKVSAAVGRPSFAVRTDGASSHDIWTYYYGDGTMTVNFTDGIVARISIAFGPPNIPKSKAR